MVRTSLTSFCTPSFERALLDYRDSATRGLEPTVLAGSISQFEAISDFERHAAQANAPVADNLIPVA